MPCRKKDGNGPTKRSRSKYTDMLDLLQRDGHGKKLLNIQAADSGTTAYKDRGPFAAVRTAHPNQ